MLFRADHTRPTSEVDERFAVQQLVSEVEESENCFAIVDAIQQDHDWNISCHQVQIVLRQVVIHSLKSFQEHKLIKF